MKLCPLSTGEADAPTSDMDKTADSGLLTTQALGAIFTIQDIPPCLMCPGCGTVFRTPYCLSCSHNVCRQCYEQEIQKNKYMRCFVCHALVVSRPYLDSGLDAVASGYLRRGGNIHNQGCDVWQQYPLAGDGGTAAANQLSSNFGSVYCGPFFCGEMTLICNRTALSLPGTTEVEHKTLCYVRLYSSIEVALVPRHRTQTAFMGLLFIYKGASPNYSAQLGAMSVKFSITVVSQLTEKHRTYECVHTFSRGGGCYNIPIGPRAVLFDGQKPYVNASGSIAIHVQASVFTTLNYEDASLLSGSVQRLVTKAKRCNSLDIEFLIERSIAHSKPDVAAHVVRFLLELASISYTIVSGPQSNSGCAVITLGFWLKDNLGFTRLLKRAIRHIDTDDYDLIGSILGRHCLVFLESSGPSAAFDITLKDGTLREEDLELACYLGKQQEEAESHALQYQEEIQDLQRRLEETEGQLRGERVKLSTVETEKTKLEHMFTREIARASKLKHALTALIGSSEEIVDSLLSADQRKTHAGMVIIPSGISINGVAGKVQREVSLLHKGYIELRGHSTRKGEAACLPSVLRRLLHNTVTFDTRAVSKSPALLQLLLKLLVAQPAVRIRYNDADSANSIDDFVVPSGKFRQIPEVHRETSTMQGQLRLLAQGKRAAATADEDRPAVMLRAPIRPHSGHTTTKPQNTRSKRS